MGFTAHVIGSEIPSKDGSRLLHMCQSNICHGGGQVS